VQMLHLDVLNVVIGTVTLAVSSENPCSEYRGHGAKLGQR
jgi:hypothetical protein